MKLVAACLGCLWLLAGGGGREAAAQWLQAGAGHRWEFPRDHHAHPAYRNEWWYVTGQLAAGDAGEPTHGFQITFFRLGLVPELPPWRSDWAARDLVLGHAAVTDLQSGRHLFSEVLTRTGPGRGGFPAMPDSVLAWCRGPAGTGAHWSLRRRAASFAATAADAQLGLWLDLELVPERGTVLQGPGGYSVKDPEANAGSLYYSLTRLAVRGSLAAGSDTLAIAGRGWLDREIFTAQLAARHRGWDWFSLQLDDGRDVMFFALRDREGRADAARATVVAADGEVRWLQPPPTALRPLRHWTSPVTQARYPIAWRLQLPEAGIDLEFAARVAAAENVGPRTGVVYWEGAVAGPGCRGYGELTGYDPAGRPLF